MKMRIGIISPVPPPLGGMSVQAVKIHDNLVKSGFQVTLISTNASLPHPFTALERIKFVRTIARTLYLLHQIQYHSKDIDVFYFLTGFLNFFLWVTFPLLLFLKIKQKRVILSAHGGGAGRFFRRWQHLARLILMIPECITVPSIFLFKEFSSTLGITCSIVPNIIDFELFRFRRRYIFRPHIIVTRNLEQIYDLPCVIRGFHSLAHIYPDACLTVVGDGSQRMKLEEMVKSLGMERRVTFLGAIPHSELPQLYADHDFFVNASRIDNLPLSILEAFACGLPVISTRAGGIPYLVEDHKTGLLFNINDHEALASAIDFLLKNPKQAQNFANNAYHSLSHYSWDNVSRILVPLLSRDQYD